MEQNRPTYWAVETVESPRLAHLDELRPTVLGTGLVLVSLRSQIFGLEPILGQRIIPPLRCEVGGGLNADVIERVRAKGTYLCDR